MTADADDIELAENMREVAKQTRAMFNALLAEGFTATEALKLVASWIHGISGGSQS